MLIAHAHSIKIKDGVEEKSGQTTEIPPTVVVFLSVKFLCPQTL